MREAFKDVGEPKRETEMERIVSRLYSLHVKIKGERDCLCGVIDRLDGPGSENNYSEKCGAPPDLIGQMNNLISLIDECADGIANTRLRLQEIV